MINNSIPNIGLILVAIICFILVLGILGMRVQLFNNSFGLIAIIVFGYVTYIFLTSSGKGCNKFDFDLLEIPFIEYIIPLIVFILIIWFITKDSGGREGPAYPTMYE
ncbi:MAG: hypothetical protein ABIG89_00875 [Candidatus Woesearchaeota archaeon]